MSPPLVTVILTTHERPEYLRQSMASVLAQSFDDFELLVCDDASGPETAAVVKSFDDPRVTHLRGEQNRGVFENSRDGYLRARGKYVARLNDDDAWEPNLLELLVPPLEADDDLVVAFSDHHLMGEDGEIDTERTELNTDRWGRRGLRPGKHQPFGDLALVSLSIPIVMCAVFRTAAIDFADLDPRSRQVTDLWFGYLACRTGLGAWYEPARLMRFRIHDETYTARGGTEWNRGFAWCYDRFLEDDRLAGLRAGLRRHAGSAHAYLGMSLLREGERREARRELLTAVRQRPALRPALAIGLTLIPEWLSGGLMRARDQARRVARAGL
jgi:glycosyltransferase involved in cell wall biosynthesis